MAGTEASTHMPGLRFNARRAAFVGSTLSLAGVGLWQLFHGLASLDNSPEEFHRLGMPLFVGAVVCFVVSVALTRAPRAPSRFSLVLGALAVVCWIAPTPFGITRFFSYVFLAMIAGRHLVGAFAACVDIRVPGNELKPGMIEQRRRQRRAAWFSVSGVITGGASLLLLIKADALGWAAAID